MPRVTHSLAMLGLPRVVRKVFSFRLLSPLNLSEYDERPREYRYEFEIFTSDSVRANL